MALQAVLAQIVKGEEVTDEAADAAIAEAERILAQDDSYEGQQMRVQKALQDRARAERLAAVAAGDLNAASEYGCWPWIRDLYPDAVIYEQDSQLYRSDYRTADDSTVTLGPAVKVKVSYVPAEQPAPVTEGAAAPPVAEAAEIELTSELVPLIEKAVRANGTVPIKIIQPGWGSSGYYSAEMPELTRKRLADDLIKRPSIKDGQLDREAMTLQVREAVKAELTYLAQATGGTGQIRGMGSNGVTSPQWQEQAESRVAKSLERLGLSEVAATSAARGR